MYFVLTQRGGKENMDTQLQKADGTSVFSFHMTYVCPFILQLWHMIVLLVIRFYDMMISFLALKIFKSQYLFHT